MSSLIARIADVLVLRPSRKPLPTGPKQCHQLNCAGGRLEVWTHTVRCHDADDAAVFVLKFGGTSGRAERSTHSPFDQWPGLKGCVWSVNPPGYGGSSGRASLESLMPMADTVYQALREVAGDRPIVVSGNSLGAVTALYVARRFDISGLVLRNPPPLRELIINRFGWWNLWLGAMLIADQVPAELCSIRNATKSNAPAVMVTSRRDRVVPRHLQLRVLRAYGGPKRLLTLRQAGHYSPLTPLEHVQYGRLMQWLQHQITERSRTMARVS